jgi:ABC-type nickel/cobalt efflux system permease component RcnA
MSLWFVLTAILISAALGAFHALEPGHGKTVVAAYLVGSRGKARHAAMLGLLVTASHTGGVYLLGLITLYASRYIVPEHLYPWLGAASGLIIAGLGMVLFVRRFEGGAEHVHDHVGHPHSHGILGHSHSQGHRHVDDHPHDHAPSHASHGRSITRRELLALGITGGIIPCPAALVVLLGAMAVGRVGFGLLLIVAFSVGLAAALIGTGFVVVFARRFMDRYHTDGPIITRWLPLASSGVITAVGIVITLRSLVTTGLF